MKRYKIIIVMLFFGKSLFACDANCVSCHPKLLKNGVMDNNHKILERCTKCHTKEENDKEHSACGQDCWSCHDITKINKIDIPEHRILPTCIKCHESINKHLFEPKGNKSIFSAETVQKIILSSKKI